MDIVRRLATEQRRRLVATILNSAEPHYPDPAEWAAFREKVMTAVGVYHDFILDVIKTSDDDGITNDLAREVKQLVHLLRLERAQ